MFHASFVCIRIFTDENKATVVLEIVLIRLYFNLKTSHTDVWMQNVLCGCFQLKLF